MSSALQTGASPTSTTNPAPTSTSTSTSASAPPNNANPSSSSTPPAIIIPASLPQVQPRITITYCTQCRWLLRAAYFAQELLTTFQDSVAEVALRPASGGVFRVHIVYAPSSTSSASPSSAGAEGADSVAGAAGAEAKHVLLWDRKTQGGFPETKVLKQLVRDCIQPNRGLGHSDRGGKKDGNSGNSSNRLNDKGRTDADADVDVDAQETNTESRANAQQEAKTDPIDATAQVRAPGQEAETNRQDCEDCK